jgi:hypothetical protein
MNVWAAMLADLPATAQRTIARFQRVSLPRGCAAEERLQRLRAALCRAKTVRAVYFTLNADLRSAIQDLRQHPRGLRPVDVVARYGALRPWSQLAADPHPQSITENLVLRGWLIMRPAAPHNPPRLIVPPELRRWLPQPLVWQACAPAQPATVIPACAAATLLLRTCAATPLAVRTDGRLTPTTLCTLLPQLQPLASTAAADLGHFVWQLLLAQGLVSYTARRATLTAAGALFLAAAPATQRERLCLAWAALPGPDRILLREMVDTRGLDWPLFCRRLQLWAAALPQDSVVDPAITYATLSAAFGPLGDAMTHGFRRVTRAPWQPRRAEAIWLAALHGPLTWLGLVVQSADCADDADGGSQTGDGGRRSLVVQSADCADGGSQTGDGGQWSRDDSQPSAVPIRLRDAVIVTASPGVLEQAARARSVRRYLAERPAPGIALVDPERIDAFVAALQRQGLALANDTGDAGMPALTDGELSAGECAALVLACNYLQCHAPQVALTIAPALLRRLERDLPAPLRASLVQARADLGLAEPPPRAQPWRPQAVRDPAEGSPAPTEPVTLLQLRRVIERCAPVELLYQDAAGATSLRTVRPLDLEQRGERWYLTAHCELAQAERTFRVDRIVRMQPVDGGR